MTAHRLTSRLGPPDEPVHRRGRVLRESHCRNTVVLAATTLSNAALGYGFWVVVTATAPAAQVGETTTVVSLMAAAALVADGGASTTAVQYMATATRQGERARFQRHLCSIVAAAAVLTSGGGLTIIGWMAGWRADLRTIVFAAVVTAAVTALALGRLADSMATADRNGGLVLRRNLWFATVKLILVGTLLIHENVMAVIVGSWAFASVSTTTVFLSRQLGGKRTIEGASSEVADSLPVSVLVRRTHHRRASRTAGLTGPLGGAPDPTSQAEVLELAIHRVSRAFQPFVRRWCTTWATSRANFRCTCCQSSSSNARVRRRLARTSSLRWLRCRSSRSHRRFPRACSLSSVTTPVDNRNSSAGPLGSWPRRSRW